MDEKDVSERENKKASDGWRSWPPFIAIKGYAEIRSKNTTKELHPMALENLSTNIG